MKTLKELSNEIGEIIVWHIIDSNLKDSKAVKILIDHVSRNAKEFVKETLRVKRWGNIEA